MQIVGIDFVGRLVANTGNQAEALWFIKTNASYGSGVQEFNHCGFIDATNGVRCGAAQTDGNAADTMFYKCMGIDLTRLLYTKNDQSVNHFFHAISASNCVHVVHCEYGGNVYVYGGNLSGCGGTGADEYPFRFQNPGNQNGNMILDGLRLEGNTKRFLQTNTNCTVRVSSATEAQASQARRMIDIKGGVVYMDGCTWATHDATLPFCAIQNSSSGVPAGLFVRNCDLGVNVAQSAKFVQNEWVLLADVDDPTQVKLEHNRYGPTRVSIPSLCSRLEFGYYTAFCQTTNATQTNCTFNGAANTWANRAQLPIVDGMYVLEITYLARQTSGANVASFVRRATIKTVAAVSTLVGTLETIGTDVNTPGWAVDLAEADVGIYPLVTGAAATTIDWLVRIRVMSALVPGNS
jgi:hypothetical protein